MDIVLAKTKMNAHLENSSPHNIKTLKELKSPVHKPPIDYETLVWVLYTTFTILAMLDRFIWNIWPRETYSIGRGSAGSDFKDGLKPGPWTVKFYDFMARASGRYTIVALNLLLFTMMHTTMAWLAETWLARRVIDFSNYREGNRRLHKWYGIGIVIMTLVHVWSIVVPCIFDGWRAQVVLGLFEWPLSERGPKGFKDINILTKTMSLQGDDVFRIIEMTILLAILLPLSIRWLHTRWHLGIHLHSLINVLYFIDIVRRHTHPHSWILNTPVFFAWLVDVLVGLYWRRKNPVIYRQELSDNYLLLFWKQKITLNTVGPKYFLRLKDSSCFERAHVFTAFENRENLDLANGHEWSTCVLVRVYNNYRNLRIPRQDKVSHTHRIFEQEDLKLYTWGPFLGNTSESMMRAMNSDRPITLVAGGSAAGYLIDAVQQHKAATCSKLTVIYTTNDTALFQWIVNVFKVLKNSFSMEKVSTVLALTNGSEHSLDRSALVDELQDGMDSSSNPSESSSQQTNGSIFLQYGRLNFTKQIEKGCITFFQGSGELQNAVRNACKANRSKLIAGPAFDQEQKKKKYFLQSLRKNCFRSGDDLA